MQVFTKADVIGSNTLIGEFSCVLSFKIVEKLNQVANKVES